MDLIVKCKYCSGFEYYGEMRWLGGREMCRDCYRAEYEARTGTIYGWDDLDGPKPTMKDYERQETVL